MKHVIFLFTACLICLIGCNFTASASQDGQSATYLSSGDFSDELKNDLLNTYDLIINRNRMESIHAITLIINHLDPITPDLEYLLSRLKTTKYALIKRKYSMAENLMKNTLIKLGII